MTACRWKFHRPRLIAAPRGATARSHPARLGMALQEIAALEACHSELAEHGDNRSTLAQDER